MFRQHFDAMGNYDFQLSNTLIGGKSLAEQSGLVEEDQTRCRKGGEICFVSIFIGIFVFLLQRSRYVNRGA